MFKVAPLSSSFMMFSLLGFIISAYFLAHPSAEIRTWAWAFVIVFVIMFISAMISLSKTPIEPGHMDRLAIHKKGHYK